MTYDWHSPQGHIDEANVRRTDPCTFCGMTFRIGRPMHRAQGTMTRCAEPRCRRPYGWYDKLWDGEVIVWVKTDGV